ncbi:hypothetical protein JYT83_00910 [bacterium AH-315-F18]|nr:hypothetical protein [bacterium AH-315-F18]
MANKSKLGLIVAILGCMVLLAIGSCAVVGFWKYRDFEEKSVEFRRIVTSKRAVVKTMRSDGGKVVTYVISDRICELLDDRFVAMKLLQEAAGDFLPRSKTGVGDGGGFKLFEVDKGSLINQLGLQPGDVIKTINGVKCHDKNSITTAYSTAIGARDVRLVLQRRGRRHELVFKSESQVWGD